MSITKIMAFLIAILFGVSLFFYISNNNKVKRILDQENRISSMQVEIHTLSETIDIIKELKVREEKELLKAREEIKSIREDRDRSVQRIGEMYESGEIDNPLLLDDIIRMLDQSCEAVRGSPCTNP